MRENFDPPLDHCQCCGSRRIAYFYEDFKGRRFHRCSDCGIQFMNPQFSDEYLVDYYAQYMDDEPDKDDERLFRNRGNFDLISRYCEDTGSVLDVGCGHGHLLEVAAERDWQPSGYDMDLSAARTLSAGKGWPMYSGDFLDLEVDETFDLVTLQHVLEHVKQPRAYLDKIHGLLRPDGLLFLGSPNIHALGASTKFWLEKLGMRRSSFGSYYDADHHLFYFTPRTLTGLLARRGFDVMSCENPPDVDFDASLPIRAARWLFVDRFHLRSTFVLIARRVG